MLLSLLPSSFRRSRHVFISGSSARAAERLARVASAAQAPEHRAQVAGQHVMVRPGLEEGICRSAELRPRATGKAQLQALWRSCGLQALEHTGRHHLKSRGSPQAELQVAHRTRGAAMMQCQCHSRRVVLGGKLVFCRIDEVEIHAEAEHTQGGLG